MSDSKQVKLLIIKPGKQLDTIVHNVTGFKALDVSIDAHNALALLHQIMDETPTVVAFLKFSRKKRRWFTSIKDLWVNQSSQLVVRHKGSSYGTTPAMSICMALLKFKGLKVKEYETPIPSNPRLQNFFSTKQN